MTPNLPTERAFLVWLSDEADPTTDRLCGRVEHVRSGRRARFESQSELNDFVSSVLNEELTPPETAVDRSTENGSQR